jgi:hypothetical protein
VFAVAGGYDAWRAGEGYSGVGLLESAWWFAYAAALMALGVFALYGSARLIRVLELLAQAREEYVRDAVQTEHRRAWRELHDVLGQTLVAISLKADLARRLLPAAPERSRAGGDRPRGARGLARGRAAHRGVAAARLGHRGARGGGARGA